MVAIGDLPAVEMSPRSRTCFGSDESEVFGLFQAPTPPRPDALDLRLSLARFHSQDRAVGIQ